MPLAELKVAMGKNPKFLRTVRHNKHPIIMNPSYGNEFDEYKMLGAEKLAVRAKLIKDNKKFAEKISLILQEEIEEKEQTKSQEDIYEEESIYTKFTGPEDNKMMPEFHKAEWDKKFSILSKFKDERLHYFGRRLIYEEKPELLPETEYNEIRRTIAKRLLSTNSEKWNTIPRTYSEIDTLREKFEREGQPERLLILDDINAYVEEMEKFYNAV
jgi:exodeoxyribonuclease-1